MDPDIELPDIERRNADLHAFERRLKEIFRNQEPKQGLWRRCLIYVSFFFILGCVFIYMDFKMYPNKPTYDRLKDNKCFTCCFVMLSVLVLLVKAHQRAYTKSILVGRTREVLHHFAMTCDDDGQIMLLNRINARNDQDHDEVLCQLCYIPDFYINDNPNYDDDTDEDESEGVDAGGVVLGPDEELGEIDENEIRGFWPFRFRS